MAISRVAALNKVSLIIALLSLVVLSAQAQVSEVEVEVNWPEWSSDNKVEVYDPSGSLILEICDPVNCQTTTANSSYSATFNIGCYADLNNYYLIALDAFGDAWNGTGSFVEVRTGGGVAINYDLTDPSTSGQQFFNVSGGGACATNDASIESLSIVDVGCGLGNSEIVTAVIRNQGSATITTCPIQYNLNGSGYQSAGSFSGSISAGSSANYSFSVDLSTAGSNSLDVRTQLSGDLNSGNDELSGTSTYNSTPHDFTTSGNYTMGFEAGENTNGWQVIDNNSDGLEWQLDNTENPLTGSNAAAYTYSPLNAADDWLFTQCLTLVAGETYELDYYYRVRSASFPESFNVVITSAQTTTSQVSTIESLTSLTNITYTQSTNTFTAPSTGTYYIAWEAVSPADQWVIYIDDVTISPVVPNDVGIVGISGPTADCELSNAELVTVTIENFGTSSINNVPVEYQVNGGGYQSAGTFVGTIAAGATATFDFTADLSGSGTQTVDARTQLTLDGNSSNDDFTGFTVENLAVSFLETSLTMGFEASEDFTGWTTLNANGDAQEWNTSSTNGPNTGSQCARIIRNNSQASDDWIFSRCVFLESAETYQLSFFYRARNANFAEIMSVSVTSAQDASSTVSNIATLTNFTNTTYAESSNTFTVGTSGTYYIAWRTTSPAARRGIHLDDISLSSLVTSWVGNSTDWADDNNWSGGVPTSSQDARVPSSPSGGNFPLINSSVSCNSLEIEGSGTLSMGASGVLTLFGNLSGAIDLSSGEVIMNGSSNQTISGISTFNDLTIDNPGTVSLMNAQSIRGALDLIDGTLSTGGNSLTLISDASGTARVAPVTSGTVSGDVTVERYIDAGSTNWRFLTSPVSGVNFQEWNDDFITSGYVGSSYPTFPFTSVYTYTESLAGSGDIGFLPLSTAFQSMNTGEGYWVWCGDQGTGTNPFTIDVTGSLNIGNVDLNVSYTSVSGASNDGWTMAGNPYASTIDWDSPGWTKTNMNNAIYIWDPDLDQYATYVGGVGTNGGSRYIASSQAFWVQASGSSPLLRASESVKVSNEPVFFDGSTPDVASINLRISRNGFQDETVIQFTEGAQVPFEKGRDAMKKYSSSPQVPHLSSMVFDEPMAINTLPELTYRVQVPVQVLVNTTGNYTIDIQQFTGFASSSCIVLEDLLTNDMINLREQSSYTFHIVDTTAAPRFLLHVSPGLKKNVTHVSCNGENNGIASVYTDGVEGPWSYVWSNDRGQILKQESYQGTNSALQGLSAGTYFIEVSSDGICPSIRDVIEITEPDPVVAEFEASTYLIDLKFNEYVDFSNSSEGATQYLWQFGDAGFSNDEEPQYKYLQQGVFTVRLAAANTNGCIDIHEQEIEVIDTRPPLGVEDLTSNEQIELIGGGGGYILDFKLIKAQDVRIALFDMQGRKVWDEEFSGVKSEQIPINETSIAGGAYTLTVQTESLVPFSRVISLP